MTLQEAIQVLHKKKSDLSKEFGIAQIGIFGSLAEGKASKASDIDLFYVLEDGRHLNIKELDSMEEKIRSILRRRKVDIVNLDFMNPIVRYRAEKHFVYV
jgi:predicted nucleotidyltransferase